MNHPHIVVLGAGYTGLGAAKLIARRGNATVTLVNARDRFVERVRLHQLASGQRLPDLPLRDLLAGTGVRLVVDRAVRIDPTARTVHLAQSETPLRYDILVYALGSQADLHSVPGVAEHAHGVTTAEQAEALRDRLVAGGTVAVVGAGLTGLEAATELAESRPELTVRLVTSGALGDGLSERGRQHLWRTVNRLGITVREHARVTEVRADGLLLADDEHLAADTVVWSTGFQVPTLARDAGLVVDGHGRMIVDETLRSVSHPEVHGIGDAAAARRRGGQELRMACATGLPGAAAAARAITARLAGREPRPLRFRYVSQCISLGRGDALVQFTRADDSPVEAVLTGRLAARYKEAIVRSTVLAERHPALLGML